MPLKRQRKYITLSRSSRLLFSLKAVYSVDQERIRLEALADELAASVDDEESHEKLMDVYERLDEIDADKAEVKAAR